MVLKRSRANSHWQTSLASGRWRLDSPLWASVPPWPFVEGFRGGRRKRGCTLRGSCFCRVR
eukprot:3274914-Alexandrium_andersonii.AAC.1